MSGPHGVQGGGAARFSFTLAFPALIWYTRKRNFPTEAGYGEKEAYK